MKIKDGFILKDVAGSKIVIATGEKSISISRLQFENKKAMDAKDCLNGNQNIKAGIFAGEKR